MAEKKTCELGDELKVIGATGDDSRLFVRHTADHELVAGVMHPVREGEPIYGNVFELESKDEAQGTYHVKDIPIPQTSTISKPACVNSREFIDGWERTFGGRQTVGQA